MIKTTFLGDGTLYLKTEHEPMGLDPLTEENDRSQAQAEAFNALSKQECDLVTMRLEGFRHLPPSKRKIAIEEYAYDELVNLTDAHRAACDGLEDARSMATMKQQEGQLRYAQTHPLIRRTHCNGQYHFNALNTSGVFTDDGYHVHEHQSGVNGAFTVISFPEGFAQYSDFAKTPEAIDYGVKMAQANIERAERDMKTAAVKLAAFKKTVRDELELIVPIEKLLK